MELINKESKVKNLDSNVLYDTIIIGGGPAGFTAAVYCMRKGLKTAMIVKLPGGQVSETSSVENYLGFRYIEGFDLVEKFKDQVKQFEIAYSEGKEVIGLESNSSQKTVILSDSTAYKTKTVIIATGCTWRKLGVPGEDEFLGRGVAYCVTCDAPLFKNKIVTVVGGGNSGVEAALDLARIARLVKLIVRGDAITADKLLTDKLSLYENVEIVYDSEINKIKGDKVVSSIVRRNRTTGELIEEPADGIFVEIGLAPNIKFADGLLALNKSGEIVIDGNCKTSIAGIYAAGDVTSVPYNQIVIAAGEGAKAALSVYHYITNTVS